MEERRGVPADRSHDIARLAGAFAAQQPDERAPAERMAALNGDSRTHHVTMDGFRLPEAPDVQASVTRLARTLGPWGSEVESGDDDMVGQVPGLVRIAAVDTAAWPGLRSTPATPGTDGGHAARAAAEAAFEGRAALAEAVVLFRDRIQRVVEGPAPGDDLPSPEPFD